MPTRLYDDWETQLRTFHLRPPFIFPSKNRRLEALFEEQVAKNKSKNALEECASNFSLTYGQLDRSAKALARSLIKIQSSYSQPESRITANLPRPATFVLLFVEPSVNVMIGFLGILKAGLAVLPLDVDTPIDRIRFVLRDAAAQIVVTQSKYKLLFNRAISNGSLPSSLHILDIQQDLDDTFADFQLPTLPQDGLDPAYCIYTSGTTGEPKAVVVPHCAAARAIRASLLEFDKPVKRKLTVVSHAFDASPYDYFGGFALGATICISDKHHFVKNPVDVLVEQQIDSVYLSPTGWALVDCDRLAQRPHRLQTIIFGGEVMPPSLLEKWVRALPKVDFYNSYGPTETAILVSVKKINTSSLNSKQGLKISVGRPFPGTAFYVADSRRRGKDIVLLGPNQMGELLIGGVQVGYGYLNRPVENAQHFVDDPFKWHLLSMKSPSSDMPCRLYRTGDLVRWNSDGEIEFMGRIKGSFVKVRGFRVELFGVQAILQKIPGVMMAIVKVERDPLEVDSIVAYLKLKIDVKMMDVAREAKRRMGPHEVPNRYVQVEEFPLNANGKVDTEALKEIGEKLTPDSLTPENSPKSHERVYSKDLVITENELASNDVEVIAQVVLKKAAIAFDRPEIAVFSQKVDLVKECGLNSITAVRFCSMIRNMYPTVEIDPHSLIHYARTPIEIAGRILNTSISSSPILGIKDEKSLGNDQSLDLNSISISRTNHTFVSSSRPVKTYELTDQAALFFGISYYEKYAAWFVNLFRKTLVHNVRKYFVFQLQPLKRSSGSASGWDHHIDPIRLHQAVDRLFESHPVLCTQIRPERTFMPAIGRYSRTANITVGIAPLIIAMEDISPLRLDLVKSSMTKAGLRKSGSSLCVAYSLQDTHVAMSVHHGISDGLFIDILMRHLNLFYQDPQRKDIPIYEPIDQSILENRILHFYPTMDKYSPLPCFNFPKVTPSIANGFTSVYWSKHDRVVITVLCGSTMDTLTEATPLVTSALVHTSGYLSQLYRRQHHQEPLNSVYGFNEMRTTHLPGRSGISIHQVCNVMQFSSSPETITRSTFQNAYRDRVSHRLDPMERVYGVCSHSLDVNIQVNTSPHSLSFLADDCGRLTDVKSWYNPVAMGAVVVDLLVAAEMGGIVLSLQISHTIPNEIRKELVPLLLKELKTLQLVAFDVRQR